ncbi:hypothetical protein [Hymenobacter sp. YC55]|uniref:hypothetical protein n=1 Tax=Hymenobacter sp. YC55 TaxID=3034019 RepID=UPI0023F742BA|nr:hypothetical protein [Hymenobacter sp. YC55]MDF7813245.1 hypothetical protein [Hymenobacter sp. YC55]
MLKFFLAAALLLQTGLSYGQQKDSEPGYLMLVREVDYTTGGQPKPSLTVIEPDGTITTEELPVIKYNFSKGQINTTVKNTSADSTSVRIRRARFGRNFIYQAEVRKLNELSNQGWVLVNTTQQGMSVQYLFRKDQQPTK